jgi:CHAT domain-containing protein
MGLRPELWQTQRFLGWCWAKLGYSEAERRALTASTDQLLKTLTDSLDGPDRAIFLLNKWTVQEENFAAQANELALLKRRAETGSRLLRPWRRLVISRQLMALLQDIDRYKDRHARQIVSGDDTPLHQRPTSFWRMLLSHPRDRATLSFLVLPDRVLVIRTERGGLDFGISPLTRIQIRAMVRAWHASVRRASIFNRHHNGEKTLSNQDERGIYVIPPGEEEKETSDAKYASTSAHITRERLALREEQRAIAAQLVDNLQLNALLDRLPTRIHALTIVPDDSLHGFPFAAVTVNGCHLVERYRLRVAFEHRDRSGNTPPINQPMGVLIGVSRGTQRFAALPGTLRELVKVRAWLRRQQFTSRHFINHHAGRCEVLESLGSATMAHIACHGVFQTDRPDQSGLVLIPQPEQVEIISLRDLAMMNLSGLHHVTLSACWSADNFVLPGRHIISLPETLWRSGVGSILGSLWEVQDRHAITFMERFYTYLTSCPRDEALRRTQLDCLHGNLPGTLADDTADPARWAGFILYGDHTRLQSVKQRG